MAYLIFKTGVTALVVVLVSEIAKRHSLMAAIIAALPVVSILTFTWLYVETRDTQKVVALCEGIAWFILPTLVFFFVLPILLKKGIAFAPAMLLSLVPMTVAYLLFLWLRRFIG